MFGLTEEQDKKVEDWMAGHEAKYCGAIGGRYTYQFTPNSLGIGVCIIDNLTKEVLDVTD